MPDLYEILGVSRDATTQEIEKAYRRKVKKAHPDAGGDREVFEALTKARDILIDPARRAKYDVDGDTAEPDNDRESIIEVFDKIIMAVVQSQDANPEMQDLAETLRDGCILLKERFVKNNEMLDRDVERLKRLADRFTTSHQDDIIAAITERRVSSALELKKENERRIEICEKALRIASTYTFDQLHVLMQNRRVYHSSTNSTVTGASSTFTIWGA
jgi:curved DNA-binding protein CbpA